MKKQHLSNLLLTWYRQALKHTKYRWVVIFGTLLYLISPLDISPDVFPILGWIDDGVVVSLLAAEVSQLMTESLKRKRDSKTTETTTTTFSTESDDTAETITVEATSLS